VFVPTRPVYGDDADVNVCNLECPLTDEGTPHPTKSYVFRGRPANVAGLTYAGIDVVSLGNNHIVDYGQRGMEETQEVLDAAGIRWSGAGDDEYAALQPIFWTERGVAVAFLGQCNRTGREYNYQPFLDAAPGKPGFAYLIEPNLGDAVAAARPYADLVVAQLHAGIEYATAPALRGGAPEAAAPVPEPPFDAASVEPGEPGPEFTTMPSYTDRQLCRRAVDAGADLVIGHHPHVLQGFEVYGGVLIAFSLGNFAFDQSFAETFPSIVLRAEFDKDGFRTFTFRPVFIDDMVPRPATGRLGREILDRQAEYSRALGAVVSTDPGAMKATIHLEPAGVSWTPSVWSRAEVPVERDGWWVTPPIERTGDGTLSRILSLEGAAGAQVRIGREILWHGDFEDEGATMWNLNSVDEVYDEDFPRQGARSLRQHRTPANSGPVTTDLQGYPPLLDVLDHSLMGWIRTENAADARITARVFTGRGGTVLGAYDAGAALSGTNGWTWRWSDFRAPSGAKYFNVRPQMERPGAGDAFAWYDEVRLVAWDAWQDASLPLDVPWPGNARFLQVRATAPADTFRIGWEERTREDPLATAGNAGGRPFPGLADLRAPSPNPFGASTWIEYRLSGRARVRLDVFDVTGRRVARLVDEERPEGAHRVSWDGRSAASGLYFVRLEAAGAVRTRKVIVLR
jgi:poly-gamma-glutamate capsule biosynthesis protein CapA/YwtB (metallophosphatase superfamily)